jgi:hypothetical protein
MQSRKMLWIGLGVGATGLTLGLAYVLFRFATRGTRSDPTTQRIQELLDEANHLMKALDDQRHSA